MQSICIFNNKGGVGKTTLLCNLAAYFSICNNKKVLVIDADPQCNATAYMFSEANLEKVYAKDTGTINDLIVSLKKSKGYADVPLIRSETFAVDVVPGDPKFSLAEDFLAKDWMDATNGEERGLKTTFLFKAVLDWATKQNYDFVFFDVGPSLGAINRTVLLSCDFFLLPMSSDIFSLRGLQNIEIALTGWKKNLERGLTTYSEDNGTPYIYSDKQIPTQLLIRFIGYVTQQYTAKTVDGKKQPVKAYEKIIQRIGIAIEKHLIKIFNKGMPLNYKLGEIPYFQSLVPMSQTATKPIFTLKANDGVVGAHFDKVQQFHGVISNIANNFINNIQEINDELAKSTDQ